jgi:hypothetical protein
MRTLLRLWLLGSFILAPLPALATAFEEHSHEQVEPVLETAKGVSVGRTVLEVQSGFRYLRSDVYFNSNGKLQAAPAEFDIWTWDINMRFGFTDNWTLWGNLPVVWSEQTNTTRPRKTDGQVGDCQLGAIYQFYRADDPTLSLGAQMRWKLPTGREGVGQQSLNITGTGTTDVELAFVGRAQLWDYIALSWSAGYNLRFPGTVQYILDGYTSMTNASIDLGDELHAELGVMAGFEYLVFNLLARFTYRFESSLALPEIRKETVRYTGPDGTQVSEVRMVYNTGDYKSWDTLDPQMRPTSSAGYMLSITPSFIIRPVEWLDINLFARLNVMGKNSIYLVNKDRNNATIDNFMPMQTLGTELFGGFVVGEVGASLLARW